MTIKVGGLGLNLQGAQRVIIFSPNWNPSIEEQAVARSYRIGQKEDVVVYKLVIRNSIEEKLVARQFHKLQVADQVMKDMHAKVQVKGGDIQELFIRRDETENTDLSRAELQNKIQQLIVKENALFQLTNDMFKRNVYNHEAHQKQQELQFVQDSLNTARNQLINLDIKSLEQVLNDNHKIEDVKIDSELEIINQLVNQNQEYNVQPSVVKSTWVLKNQVDEQDDFEVIDNVEQQLLNGDYVFDHIQQRSVNCVKIEDLRSQQQDQERVVKQSYQKNVTEVIPTLQQIFQERIFKKKKEKLDEYLEELIEEQEEKSELSKEEKPKKVKLLMDDDDLSSEVSAVTYQKPLITGDEMIDTFMDVIKQNKQKNEIVDLDDSSISVVQEKTQPKIMEVKSISDDAPFFFKEKDMESTYIIEDTESI